MKAKDYTPLIMWFVLVAGIIALAFIRRGRILSVWDEYFVDFDYIFISLYILWMLIELRVSKRDVNTEGKKTSDFMTCRLYWVGQALTFFTALWFPSSWNEPNIGHFFL